MNIRFPARHYVANKPQRKYFLALNSNFDPFSFKQIVFFQFFDTQQLEKLE